MAYPSVITSFTNPQPTDRLNSPSHSSIETAQNTGLTELQTFIGTLSSNVGTLMYDIRGAGSDGGGHVQGVNKGGTGLTGYAKGDILVATSSSVLTKKTVGDDGQVLTADSSVAGGIKWATNATGFTNKIAISSSTLTFGLSSSSETDFISVNIPGSTLGVGNAVRATVFVSEFRKNITGAPVTFRAKYGNNTISEFTVLTSVASSNFNSSAVGKIEYTLMPRTAISSQKGNVLFDIVGKNTDGSSVIGLKLHEQGTASVNSDANQDLAMSVDYIDSSSANRLTVTGYIVEKIS